MVLVWDRKRIPVPGLEELRLSATQRIPNRSSTDDGVYLPRNCPVDLSVADRRWIRIDEDPKTGLYGRNEFGSVIGHAFALPAER